MKKLKLKKGDIIIIAAVLCIAALAFLCLNLFNSSGSIASIEVDGTVVAEFPLNENTVYNVETDGRITNVVEINNGYVSVVDADCPDKICKKHKAINKKGESIICLPNKMIVTVKGSGETELDGVVR